jgi:hypothetical protein
MAATITGEVTVTVTSSVAAELIATGGIELGGLITWDDAERTQAQVAIAKALAAISKGDAESDEARERPMIPGDVTVTLPASLAIGIVEYAGLEHSDGASWRTRDGREDPNPAVAVTDALVAIAEDDLAAEFIEPAKED